MRIFPENFATFEQNNCFHILIWDSIFSPISAKLVHFLSGKNIRFFFKLLLKFSDFINSDDCIRKIPSKSVLYIPSFYSKKYFYLVVVATVPTGTVLLLCMGLRKSSMGTWSRLKKKYIFASGYSILCVIQSALNPRRKKIYFRFCL